MILPENQPALEGQRPRVLWLVRHGETTWNSRGWVQGHVDGARLTRAGRRQVREAAAQLAGHPVGTVCSSDLYRARRTASVIAGRLGCDLETDPRLRERCFGIAQGVHSTGMTSAVTGIEDGIVVDEHARPPGGESLLDVYLRCRAFLHDLRGRTQEGDVVTVAHGGSIRMLHALITGGELRGLEWGNVPNASILGLALPISYPE
jgi:broad specificity phosphatase PhoE